MLPTPSDHDDLRAIEWRRMSIATGVGLFLLIASLFGSCLLVPFLAPIFQLFMFPPALLAAICGVIGAWRRKWWLTITLTALAAILYITHDVLTDPYGCVVIIDTYFRNRPPPGLMYFHSWAHAYDVSIVPFGFAVAILTHAGVVRFRNRKWRERSRAGCCIECGYSLRGLADPRCPECGRSFDPERVAQAFDP